MRSPAGLIAGAAALAALAVLPASAAASASCQFTASGARVKIAWTSTDDHPGTYVDGTEIVVRNYKNPTEDVPCGPDTPTVTNTDKVVLRDKAGGSSGAILFAPQQFLPGATEAGGDGGPGTDEIEMVARMASGRKDLLSVSGNSDGAESYIFGANGLNFNATPGEVAPDADVALRGVDGILNDNEGDWTDLVTGRGGAGTGGTFALPMTIRGYGGNDALLGGKGRDKIIGGDGFDNMSSGAGRDKIEADDGEADAHIACGPGRDRAEIDAFDPAPISC